MQWWDKKERNLPPCKVCSRHRLFWLPSPRDAPIFRSRIFWQRRSGLRGCWKAWHPDASLWADSASNAGHSRPGMQGGHWTIQFLIKQTRHKCLKKCLMQRFVNTLLKWQCQWDLQTFLSVDLTGLIKSKEKDLVMNSPKRGYKIDLFFGNRLHKSQ